ncbi:SPOR domain-containing protein [Thermomonas carbonis]|uniref:SPOR domain-containing protein n=1 Tax=Thermomonas carbonis TaxID=1463158 RepID=A0A7G9SM69_9GAMM|nr:SPOR domain-containing protein [Thermomonas carbonis]QNN68944.1 SPOR domain-containing protein [Thermomonas carbonis]
MDASLKQRLVGAVVLVALAVIFLPMLVKGPAPDSGVSDVALDVPAEPGDDDGMVTRDLPLVAPAGVSEGGATGMPSTMPDAAAPSTQGGAFPATAAGDHAVSFGSYATAADADKVIAALKAAELPGYRDTVTLNGRQAERVRIGPFADLAVAESARLRATQVNPTVGAKVIALDAKPAAPPSLAPAPSTTVAATPTAPVKAEPLPPAVASKPAAPAAKPAIVVDAKPIAAAPKPAATTPPPASKPADTSNTGFAVQVGAFADAAAATALRDKLRSAGFNAFTDSVSTEGGTRTRVRVGPAMNRAEADALKTQVKAKAGIDGIVRPHP